MSIFTSLLAPNFLVPMSGSPGAATAAAVTNKPQRHTSRERAMIGIAYVYPPRALERAA
jgi:phosphotransferase system  glucose/maltose/N-acetylglucosamine-specific IIC component